jgi:lysozyme
MNYQATIEQIKLHEGLRLRMYKCPADKWTIGYGFNLEAREITEEVAEQLLVIVFADIEDSLLKHGLLFYEHNDARKAVLVNMAYQLGITGLLKFKRMIAAYRDCNYIQASNEMLDSRWAKQTANRAETLAEQMLTGEFQ